MLLQKEIKNNVVLKVIRMFVALLYISISVEFISRPPIADVYSVHGFKVISFFCLLLAVFSLLPLSSLACEKIKNLAELAIWFSLGVILVLHFYMFYMFGLKSTNVYIFASLAINALVQAPTAYLVEKMKNEKK